MCSAGDWPLQDDGSGRQQWQIAAVTGGYTIYMPNGRDGCTDSMAANPCGMTDTAVFAATNSTDLLQTWSITPVSPSMGEPCCPLVGCPLRAASGPPEQAPSCLGLVSLTAV